MLRPPWALQLLLAAFCVAGVRARVRQWKRVANVDDPSSWNGTTPCSNDRLVFPTNVKVVAFIQRNYTVQEVRLPANGVLLFADGVNMAFSSVPDKRRGCTRQGRVLEYSAEPKSWFDPDNWCVGRACADDDSPATYVDAEIVPCTSDDVVFADGNMVSVDVHSNPQQIVVKSLALRGEVYNSSSAFATYFNGDFGKNEFVTSEKGPRTKIAIGTSSCGDSSGCVCDNIHGYMEELVCASRRCESRLPCAYPVKADGNCCPSCGSLLNVVTDATFNMTYFRHALSAEIMASPVLVEKARYAVTKVGPSELQVLATLDRKAATKDDDPAINLGCFIRNFITTRAHALQLGVEVVGEHNSDGLTCGKHPVHDAVTQAESTRNTVIGIMVGLAIAVVFGILIFIYRKSLYWKVRLLTNRLTVTRVRFDGKTAELQTFENPVFDGVPLPFSGATDGRDKRTAVAFDARNQALVGFENPLCPDQRVAELAAAAMPPSVGYNAADDAAAPSFFGVSSFGGAQNLGAAGRGSRSGGNTGIGFDNPLASAQDASHEASVAGLTNGSGRRRVADPQPRDPALDGQPQEKKETWIGKLRLPKLFSVTSSAGASAGPSVSSSSSATKSAFDEKGFSNPLYQSPTVETLSFATGGLPYTPTESLQPHFAPTVSQQARAGATARASTTGVRDGTDQVLDDDFLHDAGDHVTISDTAELIL